MKTGSPWPGRGRAFMPHFVTMVKCQKSIRNKTCYKACCALRRGFLKVMFFFPHTKKNRDRDDVPFTYSRCLKSKSKFLIWEISGNVDGNHGFFSLPLECCGDLINMIHGFEVCHASNQ